MSKKPKYTASFDVETTAFTRGYIYWVCDEKGEIRAFDVTHQRIIEFEDEQIELLKIDLARRVEARIPIPKAALSTLPNGEASLAELKAGNTDTSSIWASKEFYLLIILLVWLLSRLGRK